MTNDQMNRRSFVAGAAAAALTRAGASGRAASNRLSSVGLFKAVAFDGFPLIDARPVAARTEQAFPGDGEQLLNAWRTRQFEYTWLRTLGGRYVDFWTTTQDALVFAARSLDLPLESTVRDRLMHTYLELEFWPDARGALVALSLPSMSTTAEMNCRRCCVPSVELYRHRNIGSRWYFRLSGNKRPGSTVNSMLRIIRRIP